MPVLERTKSAYLDWTTCHARLPKLHRYSLGAHIDKLFIEIIEAIAQAAFLAREEKLPWVRHAIRKLDALKVLFMVLWETKSLDTKKYAALSERLDVVGKMLGGWSGQLAKLNPTKRWGEK